MRWLAVLICLGLGVLTATTVEAQTAFPPGRPSDFFVAGVAPVVDFIQFTGLRHISPAAVSAQLSLHPGDRLDSAKLRRDLHALGRLGWFASIRVEEVLLSTLDSYASAPQAHVKLTFHFEEEPILSHVEYSGSRLLSTSQVEKLLEEKTLVAGVGKPADPASLQRIALAIRSALNELGHPEASVETHAHTESNGTVKVRFEIIDGPHLPIRNVRFEGDAGVSEKLLRSQMQSIAPWQAFASLRGKDAYTRAAFNEDRQRILTYYVNHGYAEARVGNPRITQVTERSRKWFPLPRLATRPGLLLSIPVHSGPYYRFESIDPSQSIQQAIEARTGKPVVFPVAEQGRSFSRQEVDKLRRFYSLHLQQRDSNSNATFFREVDANPIFDPETHTVRLKLNLSDSPPYVVRRLEFQGLHKFNDRFVRRRIPLREGYPLDERALEMGLTKLARTGYFKPIRKENIHIQLNDTRHTADVTIQLEEIGQQRASLIGGQSEFGSTLGLVYTVFDLLNHEELLSAKLEGGPESLQLLLCIAKEGIFGTRGTLAFSVFENVIRPRFIHGVQGPFSTSHSEGVSIPWSYALSSSDSVGISYALSKNITDEPLGTAPGTTGLPPIALRTHTSSSSFGTAWAHDTGNERLSFSDSASGGFLGGDENMVRASGEAARIFRDPFLSASNAWAFRTTFNAAGSYRGDAPLYSRFFNGDEFIRGLRPGDLGPLALTQTTNSSGVTTYSSSPAGANLITAANAEYRVPLRSGVQAAGFFDLGSGWLLPNWLGPAKPALLTSTNGILYGSTGVQLQWTIPGIQVPVRSYYAINILRLERLIPLPDKSILHARNRFGAFGWGLGALF